MDDYTVKYKDVTVVLSRKFIEYHRATANLQKINELFGAKLVIFDEMNQTDDIGTLQHYDKVLTEIEFDIQECFGFEKNVYFHRFWERPKCLCPKMDNAERWGTPWSITRSNCPLHGINVK